MALLHLVGASLWDDPRFLDLDDRSRCLFLALTTSPSRGVCPGLVASGPAALGERLRRPTEDVISGLRQLREYGLVQIDEIRRVIRTTVIFDIAKNQFIIKGWFKSWNEIPNDCPLKVAHVPLIAEHVTLETDKTRAAWSATFQPVLERWLSDQRDTLAATGALADGALDRLVDRGAVSPDLARQLTGEPALTTKTTGDAPPAPPRTQNLELRTKYVSTQSKVPESLHISAAHTKRVDAPPKTRVVNDVVHQLTLLQENPGIPTAYDAQGCHPPLSVESPPRRPRTEQRATTSAKAAQRRAGGSCPTHGGSPARRGKTARGGGSGGGNDAVSPVWAALGVSRRRRSS